MKPTQLLKIIYDRMFEASFPEVSIRKIH